MSNANDETPNTDLRPTAALCAIHAHLSALQDIWTEVIFGWRYRVELDPDLSFGRLYSEQAHYFTRRLRTYACEISDTPWPTSVRSTLLAAALRLQNTASHITHSIECHADQPGDHHQTDVAVEALSEALYSMLSVLGDARSQIARRHV